MVKDRRSMSCDERGDNKSEVGRCERCVMRPVEEEMWREMCFLNSLVEGWKRRFVWIV